MKKGIRILTLISILLIVVPSIGMLAVKPASAQSTPIPSVPEFTVQFVDASYNVPASSSIDPYTGQNVTHESYHVENRTIEVVIKNQPFVSYISNGDNISFYFNVREKGHRVQNWTNIYTVDNYYTSESNTNYTTLTYSLDQNVPPFWNEMNISSGGQIDFQVEALIGHIGRTVGFASWYFSGQESGWSNTQTVTVPPISTSATPSPTVPEFSGIIVALAVLIAGLPAALLRIRKTRSK